MSQEEWVRTRMEEDLKMKYLKEWDRTVEQGKVPKEYGYTISTGKTDGKNVKKRPIEREQRTLEG